MQPRWLRELFALGAFALWTSASRISNLVTPSTGRWACGAACRPHRLLSRAAWWTAKSLGFRRAYRLFRRHAVTILFQAVARLGGPGGAWDQIHATRTHR